MRANLHHCGKRVKSKSQNVLRANSYICRSYRGKTGREAFWPHSRPPPPPILNGVKVNDRVRISKYENIFAKRYIASWSEEVFVIKKVKKIGPWKYVINDLKSEEIIGTF